MWKSSLSAPVMWDMIKAHACQVEITDEAGVNKSTSRREIQPMPSMGFGMVLISEEKNTTGTSVGSTVVFPVGTKTDLFSFLAPHWRVKIARTSWNDQGSNQTCAPFRPVGGSLPTFCSQSATHKVPNKSCSKPL